MGVVVGQTFRRPTEKRNVRNRKEGKNPIHLRLFFFFVFYSAVPTARARWTSRSVRVFSFILWFFDSFSPHLSVKLRIRESGTPVRRNQCPIRLDTSPKQALLLLVLFFFFLNLLSWTPSHTSTRKYWEIHFNLKRKEGRRGKKQIGKTNENAACSKCTYLLSRCNGGEEEEPAVFVTRSDEKFPLLLFFLFLLIWWWREFCFSVCGIQEGQLEAGRNPLHPLHTLELYMRVVKLDEFDAEIVTSRRKYFLGILKSGRNISSFSVWLKLAGSFCSFPFAFVGFPFSCNPCWCFSVVKRSCINRQEVAAAYGSVPTRRGETRTPQKGETRCSLIWCFTARKVHCSV